MRIVYHTALKLALRTALAKIRGDNRGIAAVEFAMLAPMMFLLFVGSIEFSQAITVDRRVTQIASSTADLVAREKAITTAQLTQVTDIAKILMRPYETSLLKITLVSVGAKADDAGVTKVCWSHSFQGGVHTYAKGQAYSLPAGIIDKGGSVVVSEVAYDYTPLIFNYFITSMMRLQDKFYLKPRVSNMIQLDGAAICTVT